MKRNPWLLVVAALMLTLAAPLRAWADQQTTIDKVVELNRDAVAQYQKKKYEAARKLLKQALDLCEAAGLEQHPVAARTHVHLGIVIVGGFGQREIGSKQFTMALQIQPDITLTPGVASPAVQDVFNEAAVAIAPRAPAPPAAATAEAEEPPGAEPAAEAPSAEASPSVAATPGTDTERAPVETDEGLEKAAQVAKATRREAAKASNSNDDDDDDDAEPMPRARIQLGAMLGTGVGWASGMGDVNADTPVSGGFAGAKLGHLIAEAGYWMSPHLMLSLQGRFQVVSGATIVEAGGHTFQPASGATAMFAAATYKASAIVPRLRPFISAAVGAGRIRHVVTLSNLKDCGADQKQTCVDTVGGGLFLAGLGGGLSYDLGESLGLVAGINTQIGAPNFTFNVDFNAGVAFHL
jgi:hypothetical protein